MLKKITTVFILATSIFGHIFAQSVDNKSIFLDETQPDTTRIRAAFRLFSYFQGEGIDSLLWQVDALQALAEKTNKPEWSSLRYQVAGGYYLNLGKPDSALLMSEAGIPFAEKINTPIYLSRLLALNGLARVYTNDLEGAKKSFNRAHSILDKNIHLRDAATAFHYEGVLEANRDNYLPALSLLQESIRLAEKARIPGLQGLALRSIAGIFEKLGITEEATKAYQKAGALFEQQGDTYSLVSSRVSLLGLSGSEQEARAHFEYGAKIAQERHYADIYQSIHYAMGSYLYEIGQLDSAYIYLTKAATLAQNNTDEGEYLQAITNASNIAIKLGKIEEGIRQLETELPKIKKLEDKASLVTAYAALSNGYKQKGQTDRAFYYLEQYVSLKDSINNKDLTRNTIRQYLNDIHEKEKEKINAENALVQLQAKSELQQQRIFTWGLGALALLLGTLVFIFLKNLKERKAANEQLERLNLQLQNERESLAKSNQMLHGFALSISHDILNNIDLILSNGNILVDSSQNSKALGMYFDRTQRIGQQLKEYCLGLLESARGYQKQSVANAPLHDPNPTVQQIIERFRPLLEAKNFTVNYTSLPYTNIPLAIVSQVFQNLISNAVRYASDAPNPVLRIGAESQTRWIIEDNGPGIPAHLQGDLFQKAAQSDKGQGIGLVQVREILQKFEADITAENSPLGGARFVIVL